MRGSIERMERRVVMSTDFPGGRFASGLETYDVTIDTRVPTTPIVSVEWSMSATAGGGSGRVTPGDFIITMPAGSASPTFLNMILTNQIQQRVEIRAIDPDGTQRSEWRLTNATVEGFSQAAGPGGVLTDTISFGFDRIDYEFTPLLAPGIPGPTVTWWHDFAQASSSSSPIIATNSVATELSNRHTIEFAHGQLPLESFTVGVVRVSNNVVTISPSTFRWTAGADSLGYISATGRSTLLQNGIYTHRNTLGMADLRWRFQDVQFLSYGMQDSTLDDQPRKESFSLDARRVGSIGYQFDEFGNLLSSTASGFDRAQGVIWNPSGTAAYVVPPTSGLTNQPVNSLQIYFTAPQPGLTLSHLNFDGLTSAGLTLTPDVSNTVYTLSGLASQQTVDGWYAVKLLALNSGLGSSFIGSTGISWTLDRKEPTLASAVYNPDGSAPKPLSFTFTLNEPIAPVGTDLSLQLRRSDNSVVNTVQASVSADGLVVTALHNAPLPDGNYTAVIPPGSVKDGAGNVVSSSLSLPFFFLGGDANRDRAVNFNDLLILAKNYNTLGKTFSQGNFDFDPSGSVNFNDLLVLARQYGRSVLTSDAVATLRPDDVVRRRKPALEIV